MKYENTSFEDIYLNGYDSYLESGLKLNPYEVDTEEYRVWAEGFNDAVQDLSKKLQSEFGNLKNP